MWPNRQFLAGLVTFIEEIFNGKLHFLCNALPQFYSNSKSFFNRQMNVPHPRNFLTLSWRRSLLYRNHTAQKMKFSIKDFFSKCDQILSFLRMWSHLLKKSLMETSIFVQCHPTDLLSKSMDWFLHDRDLHHERVKAVVEFRAQSYFVVLCKVGIPRVYSSTFLGLSLSNAHEKTRTVYGFYVVAMDTKAFLLFT